MPDSEPPISDFTDEQKISLGMIPKATGKCRHCGADIQLWIGETWWEDVRGLEGEGTLTYCPKAPDINVGHEPEPNA